jgi:hypothetical protein
MRELNLFPTHLLNACHYKLRTLIGVTRLNQRKHFFSCTLNNSTKLTFILVFIYTFFVINQLTVASKMTSNLPSSNGIEQSWYQIGVKLLDRIRTNHVFKYLIQIRNALQIFLFETRSLRIDKPGKSDKLLKQKRVGYPTVRNLMQQRNFIAIRVEVILCKGKWRHMVNSEIQIHIQLIVAQRHNHLWWLILW